MFLRFGHKLFGWCMENLQKTRQRNLYCGHIQPLKMGLINLGPERGKNCQFLLQDFPTNLGSVR
ncbi:hypothetical protein OROHE_010292 [Orobanche hederae]